MISKIIKHKNSRSGRKIGIDARFYGPVGKGLGRYTKEVVDRVLEMDNINRYVIFLYKDNFPEFKTANPRVEKVLVKARWYSLSEQIIMPFLIWKYKINLMHFPHFNVPLFCPAKFIVTIHDLILTKHPSHRATTLSPIMYKLKYFSYKFSIKVAVWRAKRIIAVSNFTRNDLVKQLDAKKEKIIVTYEGVAGAYQRGLKKDDKNVLIRYNIHRSFLLYVGNAYPHKNLEGLIKVFPSIKEKFKGISLVLVGKEDYFYRRLKELAEKSKYKESIIFPGFIPDEDLSYIYKIAKAYIFPSFFEGFGLPPLEAMSQGCPVVSSNKTCLPEILGNAALYFNPDNEQEMIDRIERVISDEMLRLQLIKKGYEQVKKYSWDECASGTLDTYYKVARE